MRTTRNSPAAGWVGTITDSELRGRYLGSRNGAEASEKLRCSMGCNWYEWFASPAEVVLATVQSVTRRAGRVMTEIEKN